MFTAFMGTDEDISNFFDWMNILWPGLKFTYEWSKKEFTFLDVKLILTTEGF